MILRMNPSVAVALLLVGCASSTPTATAPERGVPGAPLAPAGGTGPASVLLDGDISEWPAEAAAWADEHNLYLRFTVEHEEVTLQSSTKPVAIYVDADGDVNTGKVPRGMPLNSLGVDIEVQMSPLRPRGGTSPGAAVLLHTPTGVQRFKADVVDFVATPTYAATWYEARLTRTPGSPLPLPTAGLLTQGQVAGAVVMLDETGAVEGYADPFAIAVEPVFAGGRTLHDIPMPGPAEGAVRVMSYNVERNTPLSKPESFRRLIAATRPDVLLLQEWDAGDAAAMAAWFSQIDGGEWHVAKAAGSLGDGGGVAIVSRFPLTPLPGGLTTHESSGSRPVRFVGAVVVTPAGEMLVASAHLKCCGSAGTSEDQRRLAEAGAINMMLRATAAAYPGAVRIVGGDLNLVGSRPPLDVLRAGLDADDSDLAVAVPVTWGDCTLTTWRDPGTDFPPGRLDYVLYSDANCEVTGAYVLDTGNLSESARAAMGLQAGDGAEADHLPVFIDVKRR